MVKVSISTYYQTALDLHRTGKLKEARKLYEEILKLQPKHLESQLMMGQSFFQEGRLEEALTIYTKGLSQKPGDINLSVQAARTLINLRRLEEAQEHINKLLDAYPDHPQVRFHSARLYKEMGALSEALSHYQRLLEIDPNHKHGLNNLGNLYQLMFRLDEALECYEKLIVLDENFAMAYCNKAGLLQKRDQDDEAELLYKKTLTLDPGNALAYHNLGLMAGSRHQTENALQLLQKALQLQPENIQFQSSYAYSLYQSGDSERAIELLSRLTARETIIDDPFVKLARIFVSLGNTNQAIETLRVLLHQNPNSSEGNYMMGATLDLVQDAESAEPYLIKVMDHPEYAIRATMTLQLLYAKMGRVEEYDPLMQRVTNLLVEFLQGKRVEEEFPVYNLAYFPFDQELVAKVMKKYASRFAARVAPLKQKLNFTYARSEKIRIGYLSPYYRMHPSSHMIHDILKYHDRDSFEVIAYGLNKEQDEITGRIKSVTDEYVDLSSLGMEEAARRINEDGINILVSLAGYNHGMKNEIPALRPAPVQVVCMDYHESMQASVHDYMFKDEVVMPLELRKQYSESIAFLPGCHFMHSELIPSEKALTREMYGIPEGSFVFGCLNHPRKLNPGILSAWFQLLNQVPESVLWLYGGGNNVLEKNMSALAEKNGVQAERLFFCGKEHHEDHYKRMELIDLFLDTDVYNGHTTCLEALWMSVPVLTVQGKTVSARMCSSYLSALGMNDLICQDLAEYVEKATSFGREQDKMKELQDRMAKARTSGSLFDIPTLVNNIESAYQRMWEKYTKGESPSDFKVA